MNDNRSSVVRTFIPIMIAISGILSFYAEPSSVGLSPHMIDSIGFGLFTVGSFSFVVIINHMKNPVATDEVIYNLSQSLIIFGGLLTSIVFANIISITNMIATVFLILISGTTVALIIEHSSLDSLEINNS